MQQDLVPNKKLYNPLILIIVSLLRLLYMLYSSLGRSNNLLHPGNKLCMSITLDPHAQLQC